MQELGNTLVKNREDFIDLLKYADIPLSGQELDAELIDKFISNINNRKLMVGAAYLVNRQNKTLSFDGTEVISDTGVKVVHKVMYNYFGGPVSDNFSNAAGGAWAQAADSLAKLGGNVLDQQRSKKQGASDALYRREDAKQAMAQQVLTQRQVEQQSAKKRADEHAKQIKILVWSSVGIGAIALTLGIIYAVKKARK